MAILRERLVWHRPPSKRKALAPGWINRLTPIQEANGRAALRLLRNRLGSWPKVARSMGVTLKTTEHVSSGRRRMTAGWVLRIAALLVVTVDDVLTGRLPKTGSCPMCGCPTDPHKRQGIEMT